MNKQLMLSIALVATTQLVACGGGGGGGSSGTSANEILVPNIGAGTNFSFDLGVVTNHSAGRYYFTDRFNQSVDMVDIASGTLTLITGTGANAFTGCRPNASCAAVNNGLSGPDGINDIHYDVAGGATVNKIYAGDVNSVKVIDPVSLTVTKTITNVGNPASGNRADEGCLDAVHHQFWISSPEDTPPVATIIDTDTDAIVAKITFPGGAGNGPGLEQCRYDPASDTWFVNNDGTTAHPNGELDVVPGTSVRGIAAGASVDFSTLVGIKIFDESTTSPCDPTGLALGPGTDIAVNCRTTLLGAPLFVKIFNRTTGALVADVAAGGGDQLEFDLTSNRYFSGSSRWNASGKVIDRTGAGACTALDPCTPVLGVIDATTHAVIALHPTGNNAHSVAVDSVTGKVFVPHSSDTSPAGANVSAFSNGSSPALGRGGISIFSAM